MCMQFIDIAEKEWEVFKHRLLQKTNFTGIFVIRGLSEQVTSQLSILLEAAVRSDYYLYYFLCSGSKAFHIPCYMSASALQETSDIPTPYDVLENANLLRPQPPFFSPHQAVYNLNKEVINRQGISQLLVLECITAPTENDQLFILYLLRSILLKHIPVLIFVHQASVKKNFKCFQEKNTLNDILYTMYICGGRIAKSDFESLLQYVSLPYEQVERYFALRSAQEES